MGSIYFLLDGTEVSHFHQIDCEEVWYFHEGCGLRITMIQDGQDGAEAPSRKPQITELLLGGDTASGQRAMVVIPKGAIFASENLDPAGYSFVSCATAPAFSYEGFRLVKKAELKRLCEQSVCSKTGPQTPADYEKLAHLAFE